MGLPCEFGVRCKFWWVLETSNIDPFLLKVLIHSPTKVDSIKCQRIINILLVESYHVHKQITERRYKVEKPGRFVFGKPVLFTLGRGLTTPYSLGISVWNFYQTFVTVSTEFWLRFEPQIRTTELAINFLFITARAERKVRLCIKLFHSFRGWILIRLTWNLSRFVPNSVEILTWNFRKKLFQENFSEILRKPRRPLPKLVKFRPTLWNFILGPYYAEKIHTSTFICCLDPGKEARP